MFIYFCFGAAFVTGVVGLLDVINHAQTTNCLLASIAASMIGILWKNL